MGVGSEEKEERVFVLVEVRLFWAGVKVEDCSGGDGEKGVRCVCVFFFGKRR